MRIHLLCLVAISFLPIRPAQSLTITDLDCDAALNQWTEFARVPVLVNSIGQLEFSISQGTAIVDASQLREGQPFTINTPISSDVSPFASTTFSATVDGLPPWLNYRRQDVTAAAGSSGIDLPLNFDVVGPPQNGGTAFVTITGQSNLVVATGASGSDAGDPGESSILLARNIALSETPGGYLFELSPSDMAGFPSGKTLTSRVTFGDQANQAGGLRLSTHLQFTAEPNPWFDFYMFESFSGGQVFRQRSGRQVTLKGGPPAINQEVDVVVEYQTFNCTPTN